MSSANTPKTVELYGYGVQAEAEALAGITPGMLVERAAGGVQPHSTAAGGGQTAIAQPYGLTGRGIDDAYASGDQVIFKSYVPGSGVYALLPANASAVSEGDFLYSAGDGTLEGGAAGVAVAQALEDVDNSTNGSPARIRAEILPQFTVA